MPADTTEKQPGAETDAGRHNRHWPQGRKGAEMHKTETKTEAAKPAQTAPAVHLCPSCRIDHDDYTPDASGEYARVCGVCGWKHGKPETKTEAAKPTPGPWETVRTAIDGQETSWVIRAPKSPGYVARVRNSHEPEEVAANARLIAAAPELAEALTGLVDRFAANALNVLAYDDEEPCCQLCGEPHTFKDDPDNILDRGTTESWDEHHKPGCLMQQARAALAKAGL